MVWKCDMTGSNLNRLIENCGGGKSRKIRYDQQNNEVWQGEKLDKKGKILYLIKIYAGHGNIKHITGKDTRLHHQ